MLDHGLTELKQDGLFFQNWHYFFLGSLLALQSMNVRYIHRILVFWVAIEMLFLISNEISPYILTGLITTLFIYIAYRKKLLNTLLTGRVIQYFGAISYSLYLLHADVGWKVLSLGKLYFGEDMLPILSLLVLCAGIIVSILVAHVMNILVEKPSIKLAGRLKLAKQS